MLYTSGTARALTARLRESGFEELLPLGTVPVPNARRMHYPMRVTARRDGSRWEVRCHGTDFHLVDPRRRDLRGRWFSLGWGMHGPRPVDALLLLQADEDDEAGAHRLAETVAAPLTGRAVHVTHRVTTDDRTAMLRLSAVLRPLPEERD